MISKQTNKQKNKKKRRKEMIGRGRGSVRERGNKNKILCLLELMGSFFTLPQNPSPIASLIEEYNSI